MKMKSKTFNIEPKKANPLAIAWLVVGTLFGFTLNYLFSSDSEIPKHKYQVVLKSGKAIDADVLTGVIYAPSSGDTVAVQLTYLDRELIQGAIIGPYPITNVVKPCDNKRLLYNSLVYTGLYSKSFDDFSQQFSSPEKIDKLYYHSVRKGVYDKGKEDFYRDYFSNHLITPVGYKPLVNVIERAVVRITGL